MIEGSSSLNQWGENNFQKVVNTTRQVVSYFTDPQTKLGFVLYATTAEVKANLSRLSRDETNGILSNLSYPAGWTRIGTALNVTREQLFVNSRSNVHRVLVVITDGTSNNAVSVASDLLHDINITIIVVAFGDWYDSRQVQRMASDPDAETTLIARFDDFENVGRKMHEMICRGNKELRNGPLKSDGGGGGYKKQKKIVQGKRTRVNESSTCTSIFLASP